MEGKNRQYLVFLGICSVVFILSYILNRPSAIVPVPKFESKIPYIPQFVLISFDGSKSNKIWEETRTFAREMNIKKKPLHFTYFINAAYFLTNEKAFNYEGPGQQRGTSMIGFSETLGTLKKRIEEVNSALKEGHEIGSHTVGHFEGGRWSLSDWQKEFQSFNDVMFGIQENFKGENMPKLNLKQEDVIGFRAPELSINNNMYKTLSDFHFSYDTSETGKSDDWPIKDSFGIWHIPLGTMNLNGRNGSIIAMDYNFYMNDTGIQDILKRDDEHWKSSHDAILFGYLGYFDKNYNGYRAPVVIGNHFEKWNDGLYWETLKEFAEEVCGKPEVRCTTYREYVKYLNEYGVPGKFCSSGSKSCDIN